MLRLKKRLAAVFAAAAVLILLGGIAYHHRHLRSVQKDAGNLLSSIRHFKTEQILFWRADRFSDTNSLLDTPVLSIVLNRVAAAPADADAREQIKARLQRYLKHNRYRSALLAWSDGRILLSAGEAPKELQQETKDLIARSAASGKTELGDLYVDNGGKPRMDLASRAASAPGGRKLFLVLEIAPEDYLYPMIKQWPTNSATGETMLVRQEGEYAVALNDLRLATNSPLQLRIPQAGESPAQQALKGKTGTVFGTDYRGRKVMASVGLIPATGWAIVVKMDWAEVLESHGRASALIFLFTFFLLLAAGVVVYMLFLLQEAGYRRSLQEVESERERYRFSYETLSDKANDMILLADPVRRTLLMVNHKACEVYGYTEEEMLRLHPENLIPPENISVFNERFKTLAKGAGLVYETEHLKKNGERFPIEVSATGISQEGRDLVHFICRDISERKRMEKELRDRERRLAGVMYNLPGMAYRCKNDPQWTMDFVSQGCESLTGYKPAELLGNNAVSYNDLIVAEDRDRVWREVQSAVNADRPYQLIYRIRGKDGEERMVWEQGNAVKGPDGRVEALEGLIIDNSEKAAAEAALRESETRYQQLFNSMEEGFSIHELICDEKGRPCDYRFLEVNPAFERLTGLKRKNIIGRRALEVLPKLEKDWVEGFGKVALTGVPAHFENYAAELGRWYAVSVFSPKKGQFAVTFFDITEQKLAGEKLSKANGDWRKTFDSIDDVIWVLGPDHKILRANAATEKVIARKPGEILGSHCWEIVHGTTAPIEGCPVTRVSKTLRREVMDYRLGDKYFEVIADPILGPGGVYAGAVHVLRDVTQEKLAMLRTEQLNADLRRSLRVSNVLAQVNQAAAQLKERDKLFSRLCEIAVKTAGFRMAWIGYPDKDTGRVLPLCSAGETGHYLESIKISTSEGPAGRGPTGEAAATGLIAACQDIASDPRMEPWREKAMVAGFASSAAVPLYDGTKLVALLSLYSEEKNAFDAAELKVLTSVQAEASLAIAAISSEKQRAEAQAGLERTARHLSHALEASPIVLFTLVVMGEKFIPQWVSGNPRGITGHDPEEILGVTWFKDSLHPEDKARVISEAAEVMKKGSLTHEFRLRKKEGGYAWVREVLKLSRDNPGEITGSWTDITPQKEAELNCKKLLEGRKP